MTSKSFKPQIDVIHDMQDFVKTAVSGMVSDKKALMKIDLMVEELAVNIIKYGCRDMPDGMITLAVQDSGGKAVLKISDNGVAFNPLEQDAPDVSAGIEERRAGGLGIFLVRQIAEEMTYERSGHKNITCLTLKL